jgi:uncharacterized protein (TIGR01244 family)
MATLIPLNEHVMVAGQIAPADVADLARQGITAIVNNRPDGEEPGQPDGDAIAAAAHAAGLAYVHIPVGHAGMGEAHVAAMADALESAPGRVLAFCRSGTRSTFLWALARASRGDDADDLISTAAAAGYDIRPIAPALRRMRG